MSSDSFLLRVILAAAALFVVATMGSTLTGSRVFLGVDVLTQWEPWRSHLEDPVDQVDNECISDTIDGFLPTRAEFRRRLYSGDFPLWSPLSVGGRPLGSVPNLGSLSPLNLGYLILPLWIAPAVTKLAELGVAMGFMFLFLRRVGLSRLAGLLGGIVFWGAGFNVVWTNWNHPHVAALIPALFWAGERFVQLRTPRSATPIAVVTAVMLAEGFPVVLGYAALAWAPYMALRILIEDRGASWRGAATLVTGGGALGLGAGLMAVQLVPFFGGLSEITAVRAQDPSMHLPPQSLASLVIPRYFGTLPSCPAIEGSAFLGAGALVLVVLAVTLGRPARIKTGVMAFSVGATALTVALGWVGGPLLQLAQTTPVFSINNVGRIRSLLGFLLAVLAAIGFEHVVRGVRRTPRGPAGWARKARAGVVAGGAPVLVGLGIRVVQRRIEAGEGRFDALRVDLVLALAIATLTLAAVLLGRRFQGSTRKIALGAVVLLVVLQPAGFARWFWPRSDRAFFYPTTATHSFLAKELGRDRFAAAGLTMQPGSHGFFGFRSATGHSFTDPRWADLLRAADANVFRSPTYSALGVGAASAPVLDRLSVRWFVTSSDTQPYGLAESPSRHPSGRVVLGSREVLTSTLPAGTVRGVEVELAEALPARDPPHRLDVSVVDQDGRELGAGFRYLFDEVAPGPVIVPVAPEVREASGLQVQIRAGTTHPIELTAGDNGAPIVGVVRADARDELRLAHVDGAVVWERMRSLPRFRWASRARVVPDAAERIALLRSGTLDSGTVVLNAPGPGGAGAPATVSVLEDSGDVIRVRVQAEGQGHLVVADALQDDWEVRVDGEEAPLVAADHALVAVAVPAGDHQIRLAYSPPGWNLGRGVSIASVAVLVSPWILPALRRRSRRLLRRSGGGGA